MNKQLRLRVFIQAFSLLLLLVPTATWAECTTVLGFSQTGHWYNAGFENYVRNSEWQRKTQGGAGIEKWADPKNKVWNAGVGSKCASRTVTGVLLTVSSSRLGRNVNAYVRAITDTIKNIDIKFPQTKIITLQSVVGGRDKNGRPCRYRGKEVRAARQWPAINKAIDNVMAKRIQGVVRGLRPEVRSCGEFRDGTGHMNGVCS